MMLFETMHWTDVAPELIVQAMSRRDAMHADDFRSTASLRHGAYLCLQLDEPGRSALAASAVPELCASLGLCDEYEPGADHPEAAVAFLRRLDSRAGSIEDPGLLRADAVIHVAASTPQPLAALQRAVAAVLDPGALRVLGGVVRPPSYTGTLMHNYAYAQRVLQQSGPRMPNAFLLPLSKTAAWWNKSWMERHTYILPRYADSGELLAEGHARVCEPGIASLYRRTYKQEAEPAPADSYDFINYFECADAHVPTFNAICDALRDERRNPEWRYVREGPLWHGQRVSSLQAMCSPGP